MNGYSAFPLLRARRMAREGRFLAAADLLCSAFRGHPEDADVAEELAEVLRAVGDLEGSEDYFRRAECARGGGPGGRPRPSAA